MTFTLGGTGGEHGGGIVCDTEYLNCHPNDGGQTGPIGFQTSSPHDIDPTLLATTPARYRTTTSTFLTTVDNEISTHMPSSSKPLHATTYSSPEVLELPHPPPPQLSTIQITTVSTATLAVTALASKSNPASTITQTSTSNVESTQGRGAGLSVGAAAGIVVASLVFALLASAGSWLLWKRRRRHTTALSHNLPGGSTSALWRTSYGDEALPPYVTSRSEGTKGPVFESEKTSLPALPQYGYTLDEPQVQYGSEIACDDDTSIYGLDDISRLGPSRPLRRVE